MQLVDRFVLAVGNLIFNKFERGRGFTLLRFDPFRILIAKWRRDYFIKRKGNLRVWDGSAEKLAVMTNGMSTVEHNLQGLHDISGIRGLRIIRPLLAIETYRPLNVMPYTSGYDQDYICNAKVLDIGPRTEGEILSLIAHGFRKDNIKSLDLISYSPLVDVGDMHAMPYAADEFDIVIASCVLVYSKQPKTACEEIIRVAKSGGLVCVSQDTEAVTGEFAIDSLGRQLIYIDDYLELFAPYVERVFYQHELPELLQSPALYEGPKYTLGLIFQVKK